MKNACPSVLLSTLIFGLLSSGWGCSESAQSKDTSSLATAQNKLSSQTSTVERVTLRTSRDTQGNDTFQEGNLPDSSYQHHGADIWQCDPSLNFEGDEMFVMGRNDGGGLDACFLWPYLNFDVSAHIPPEASVIQATVSLYSYDGYGSLQTGASHKVLSDWDESTLTYNNKPGDWDNGIYESQVYITGINAWWDWDVTQMVSQWVADPSSNHGLAIMPIDSLADGDFLVWYSDDASQTNLRPRLVIDYVIPDHRSSFVVQQAPPTSMLPGQTSQVSLTFQNDGADTWDPASGYRLGSQTPEDNTTWGLNRVDLSAPIGPGSQAQFSFEVSAPQTPGSYTFQWKMIHEGVQWYGSPSPAVEVTVGRKPPGESCTGTSECDSGICVDGVCCDAGCTGTCMTCILPGFEGNCRFVPEGQDLDDECPGVPPCGASCNGLGACVFVPAATSCAMCADCDGAGNCDQYYASDSDPDDTCGLCSVCPGDGPDCVAVSAGSDPLNECAESDPSTCGQTGMCDGQQACALFPAGTICQPESCGADIHSPDDLCDGAGQCLDTPDQACHPYTCLDQNTCRSDCTDDDQCQGDSYCLNNSCAAYLQRGEPCTQDYECITTHCVDQVCCDESCQEACTTCNLAADPGGCYPTPDGEDPRDDCQGTGVCGGVCDGAQACRFPPPEQHCDLCTTCDGAGACALYAPMNSDPFDDCQPCWTCSGQDSSCRVVGADEDPQDDCSSESEQSCSTSGACDGSGSCQLWPADTICQAATCSAGLLIPADLCDGSGTCQDLGQVECSPYACLSDSACRSECAQDDHCLDGFYCLDSQCVPLLALGEPCERSTQCQQDHCVDGVCCADDCSGLCQRCDQAQDPGTCTPLQAGLDPDAECAGDGACGGSCDGAGACALPGQETSCGPCALCDGDGGCTVLIPSGEDPSDLCGPCRVCAGDRDECLPVSAGEDPLDECTFAEAHTCGLDGTCNGQGACRNWTEGTACGPQGCIAGMIQKAPTCDGLGTCTDRGTIPCDPYSCDGTNCAGPSDLSFVAIEDESGQRIEQRTLTTDDTLEVFAVGYDAQGNNLGPIMVTWLVDGEIGIIAPGPSTSATFDPTLPGSGQLIADFYLEEVLDGSSGVLTVQPGLPAGEIFLDPQPTMLPADGLSLAQVFGGPVLDRDDNPVAPSTRITVLASAGALVSDDMDAAEPGIQRHTDLSGMFSFQLQAADSPGRAQLLALALAPATARGEGVIYFGDGGPVADAGLDQEVQPGQTVFLDGSASFDPQGRALVWYWEQISGEPVVLEGSDGERPSFVVPDQPAADSIAIQLTVGADEDLSSPDTVDIAIVGSDPDRPRAVMTLTPDQGAPPLTVDLDGSASTAADCCTLQNYIWSFSDDGAPLTGPNAEREFAQPGGVGVQLLVIDDRGNFSSTSGQVSLSTADNQPPLLSLSASPRSGDAPLDVSFSAQASDPDGQVESVEWDFGGGFGPTGPTQQHLFTQAGHYTIRARATDDDGLSSLASVMISVSAQGEYPPIIVSAPGLSATAGQTYGYQPTALGSRPMEWSLGRDVGGQLQGAPEGATMDTTTGSVGWTPTSAQAGPVSITVVARNHAGVDFQDFVVEVQGGRKKGSGCGCSSSSATGPSFCLTLLGMLLLFRRRTSGGQ